MIKLYIFPPCWGMPSPSPFCIKVEAYLKLAGLPYEAVHITDPREAPKGKLPYVEAEGKSLGDSHLIIEYLESKLESPLDSHLTQQQKAVALATKRMLDEHLVWATVYSRWVPEKNFKIIKNTFFSESSGPMKAIIIKKVRKYMLKSLQAQGMGRHSEEEVYQLGREDLAALSAQLGDAPYFFGNKPSTLDATAYAHIASIIHAPIESPLKRFSLEQANLVNLCERIDAEFFKDS